MSRARVGWSSRSRSSFTRYSFAATRPDRYDSRNRSGARHSEVVRISATARAPGSPGLNNRLDLAQCNEAHSEIYFGVSAKFADALMPLIKPDDLISIAEAPESTISRRLSSIAITSIRPTRPL